MSARQFNYFDDYETPVLECSKCGWKGTFRQGFVDYYSELMDSTCPNCKISDAPILAIVSYPTLAEARANSDRPAIRDWVQQIETGTKSFEEQKLRTPEQLPEISADSFTLVWDFESDEHCDNPRTVIKHEGTAIFSEPARWEEYERYEEVAEILKVKYGNRIKDLLPTLRSEYYLCGDSGRSYDFVDQVRLRLFVGDSTLIDWAERFPPRRPPWERNIIPIQLWLFRDL
jgi:hypothetical protein